MNSILLIFRKRRAAENYSIEASFSEMVRAFRQQHPELQLEEFISSHLSLGILPRLRGMLEVTRCKARVYHVTGDVHFLTLGLPGSRTVLTVHDCGFLERDRGRLSRWLLKKIWLDWPVAHCRVVTAVSEATRADIIRHTRCRPDKVVVIPTVISSAFDEAPAAFNTACPTVLHIGMAPNKNFFRHVEALAGLPCRMHIIGKLEATHMAYLERHGIDYRAAHNLSIVEVKQAYCDCDILLFASTLEGFGMPVIEAQTVGRVVVTSNLSSMPEVAGGAACLVDPYDVVSIRAGLERLIADAPFRDGLITAGRTNALRFRATSVARRYLAVYEEILREEPGVSPPE